MLTPETDLPQKISDVVEGSPYQAYTYSYPHKSAYRILDGPTQLRDVWKTEDQSALFLYVHIPFCEHRCGFCNLFTQANPEDGLTQRYLRQLKHEATAVRKALNDEARFAQLAIGGGTPTFLEEGELQQLFQLCESLGVHGSRIPVSIEASPATVTKGRLQLLSEFQTERISIGIQSFNEAEARRLGRPQRQDDVKTALQLIREADFPVLNVDLIYGGEGQSVSEWMTCVKEAVTWTPEEIYLYPLYVRPLTGLGRLDHSWDDQRLEAYREARDFLRTAGYVQSSMRMFHQKSAQQASVPEYHCQTDGMVGLGCGARSYTRDLHYSTEYAVGRRGVHSILLDYVNRSAESFEAARYGIPLSEEDRRRRFAILSLLQRDGLSRSEYVRQFGVDVLEHQPELLALEEHGLAEFSSDIVRLTDSGMERSDAVGPWLYSPHVQNLMQNYELV